MDAMGHFLSAFTETLITFVYHVSSDESFLAHYR